MDFLKKLVTASVLLLLIFCNVADYTVPPVEIRTDKATYSQGEQITISIQNVGKETLVLVRPCLSTFSYLHEWDGKKWIKHYPEPLFCNWPPPVYIEPGEITEHLRFAMMSPGIYRIPFHLYIQAENGELVDEKYSVSNVFEVK